jgi:dipeptidase E
MRQSGLADLLPSRRPVWVGLSGGSMVMTPSIGADFDQTAIKVTDGAVEVVSEGHWRLFTP